MKLQKWHGIHTVLITPFRNDFALDLEGHRRNVEFAAKSSAHILVCLGTQGEFSSLSLEERKALMRATVEMTRGRKPVICGTGSSSTLEVIELNRYAKDIGADAVMVTAPYFAEVTTEGVVEHFERIGDACDIPMFLYNAPARAGFNLTPQLLPRLAEVKSIVGVKQATRNVTELEETMTAVADRMVVIGGAEAMIWPCLALGMHGNTSTAASFMPDPMVKIYEAARAADFRTGLKLYNDQADLRALAKSLGHAAVVKVGMDYVGLAGGPVRPPLRTPDAAQRTRIEKALQDFGVRRSE